MKRLIRSVVVAMFVATAALAETWNFDADPVNAPPPGFSFGRTGKGKPGRWVVQAEKDAPSAGNVLAQLDTDSTNYRFPVSGRGQLLPDACQRPRGQREPVLREGREPAADHGMAREGDDWDVAP